MTQVLTDAQRSAIHNLALTAREILTREARELLEGVYGLHAGGRLEAADRLPQVREDAEAAETYRRLKDFLADSLKAAGEAKAGLPRAEAVDKLVKEVAFTHLNRLVAFKMMEARKLIRGALDKGAESNGFKFYLADPAHAQDYECYQRGDVYTAYRHFLLWQAGQVADEVRVLFDPDTLPSRLFPRQRTLNQLLELLNQPGLTDAWQADETIGWMYQYFNEPELQAAFEKVRTSAAKFEAHDIPAATQLFTPHWVVRFLVQNTLGRLWVELHPDTRLLGVPLLDYLVRSNDFRSDQANVKLAKDITLLDPACGAMHFGLVAFDLFAAMYREELERAGEPGWPAIPSVADVAEIPAAILAHNIYGIDIDLRAVQLSALALYLKAKSLNKAARITRSNLACADVQPLDGARLGAFLHAMRFERPVYERLIRKLWERLRDANQLGSLLRLEQELGALIDEERARLAKTPLFAGVPGEFEREAAEVEYWSILSAQVVQALDEFARQQAAQGADQSFFTGEAVKGLRLAELMMRDYDVVVTNPPYLSRRKMNSKLAALLDDAFPEGKSDFYAAFTQRCLEFAGEHGRVGMLTMHSFMFISSYEPLRATIRQQASIETLAHFGPALFEVGNPGTLQTAAFVLRKEPEARTREAVSGVYFRLVHAPSGESKRLAFEQALIDGSNIYRVAQRRFDAIPGSPWVYWVSDAIRDLFETLPSLEDIARPTVGLQTGENRRFLRYWWEVGRTNIAFGCRNCQEVQSTNKRWFPYMKGGEYRKWYGNQEHVVNWHDNAAEIEAFKPASVIRNPSYYFREGVTWTDLGAIGFSARISPGGFAFDVSGSCAFPESRRQIPALLAVMNSGSTGYLLNLLNPTMHFQVGDLARLPIKLGVLDLEVAVDACVRVGKLQSMQDETTFDFIASPCWDTGLQDLAAAEARLAQLEAQIDDRLYRLYGIGDEDRAAIEAELKGGTIAAQDDDNEGGAADEEEGEAEPVASLTQQELAVRWISYAVGIVLGRFQPGVPGALGCAVYRRADFAVGSLPVPDETEFDELVGPAERFAYVDAEGGRHVFSAEVEAALRALAVPDGITVLDEGHPRDLPALVERALVWMLGAPNAAEVIRIGAEGNLRAFLSRAFFTNWHFKWYRKRPVYWPLQSAKRSYGFVLFHERITKDTLYLIQRDYLDHKLNGLQLQIRDLAGRSEGVAGSERKQVSRQMYQVVQLLGELTEFAKTMEAVVRGGYEPAPNWIDDGVILRMAPLWELVPIWKAEPKKYWERLEKGDFDWSHIAMHYWPERVKDKCRSNKSFAIAHGLAWNDL